MARKISLYFTGKDNPALEQVEFYHPISKESYLSVRGKTSGSYETDRTFQWTTAVQAMAILFLRTALYNLNRNSLRMRPPQPVLEGEKGSIAVSLDYALDKQPTWLLDMFGADGSGRAYFRSFITRSNPGLRRDGPTRIGINADDFAQDGIKVYWNSETVINEMEILQLLRTLEKLTGTVSADEVKRQVQDSPVNTHSYKVEPEPPRVFHSRPSPHSAVFKTPFIQQGIFDGDAYVRCYEQDMHIALVVCFVPYEEFDRRRRVPVRIHSSCAPSEALDAIDCDCKTQLDSAIQVLRKEKGILIYLEQEGRGAGLYSKYQGLSISSHTGVDTYEAYRKMSLAIDLRTYELPGTILRDLGVTQIDLLTNNPTKAKGLRDLGLDVETRNCFGNLTPQNLTYLYSKLTNGNHDLGALFSPAQKLFYLLEMPLTTRRFERAWIFGGDDTLWEDNIVYEDIIRLFIDHICKYLTIARDKVRKHLDEIEAEIIPELGFGAPGFLESIKRTYRYICAEFSAIIPEPKELFDSVFPRLSAIAAEIPHRTTEVLRKLRRKGDGLILFVQGPLNFQLSKVAQSKLGEFFHAIVIVPEKSTDSLQMLMKNLSFVADNYVVVGNNLETDILPATTLGIDAVYYNNPNSWQLLNRVGGSADGYKVIWQLEEVLLY